MDRNIQYFYRKISPTFGYFNVIMQAGDTGKTTLMVFTGLNDILQRQCIQQLLPKCLTSCSFMCGWQKCMSPANCKTPGRL